MIKRTIAITVSLILILCQSIICFGEGTDNNALFSTNLTAPTIKYDFNDGVEGFTRSGGVTISASGGILTYKSVLSGGQSGWMTKTVDFLGSSYNRIKIRCKVQEAYKPISAFTYPAIQFYYGGIDKDGNSIGPNSARTTFIGYGALSYDSTTGIYSSSEYKDYIIDLSNVSGWSTSQITLIRFDLLKNGEGTVLVDYIEFYYEAPIIDPDPPESTPEMLEGEQWYANEFTSGIDGWTAVTSSQITLTQTKGMLKYVSKLNDQGVSGWMQKSVSFDTQQYYRVDLRVKLQDVAPLSNGGTPYLRMYYSCIDADGVSQGSSESRSITLKYNATLNENGTYDSDWVDYSIDLSGLNGWGTARSITSIRFDVLKNTSGVVYIDYIRFLSTPTIKEIGYNGQRNVHPQEFPVDVKTIEAYLSQALEVESINKNTVTIYDEDNVPVEIDNVVYNTVENRIIVTLVRELASITDYTVEIANQAKVNKLMNLYSPIRKSFKTLPSTFEVDDVSHTKDSATMAIINFDNILRKVLVIATLWDGNKYVGKKVNIVEVLPNTTVESTVDYSEIGGNRAEVVVWDYTSGRPKTVSRKVYVYDRL